MRLERRAAANASIGLVLLATLPALMIALTPPIGKLIGIVAVAALLALAVVCAKRRLVIDDRGVTAKTAFSVRRLDWNDVDHYTFWSVDKTMVYGASAGVLALGVLVVMAVIAFVRALRNTGRKSNRRFAEGQLVLVGRDGTVIRIDARYHQAGHAVDRCFAELHPRLRAMARLDFTPFVLGDTELRHAKKGPIGLADIQSVGAGGARISIKKRDKRLAWANVPMKRIKNVMLFVELLAERGLVIKAKAEVFMPPSVLDKLRAAASRQAAMPQARVIARD